MPGYKFLVFSNPAEGREDDYNAWYDNTHLGEVLQVPGFTKASRFRVQPNGDDAPRHRYLAVYEMDGEPSATLGELMKRAGNGTLQMSDALGEVETLLVEELVSARAEA